jgi:hypothetical protein
MKNGIKIYREILIFGIYPKQLKSESQGEICVPRFIAALLTIVKSRSKCPYW